MYILIWCKSTTMTHIISIVSGKGGVGKSTTVANLGVALAEFNKDVTLIDANFFTPNLSLHFGTPPSAPTIHQVMRGESNIEEATQVHSTGAKIIPASLSLLELKRVRPRRIFKVVKKISGDFVLLDTQAGIGDDVKEAIKASDSVIVVTNLEWPAITDALKIILICKEEGVRVRGVVLNRVRRDRIEPGMRNVQSLLESEILGIIPEDSHVRKSIAMKDPVVVSYPNSDAAVAYKALAARLVGINYKAPHVFARKMRELLRKLNAK